MRKLSQNDDWERANLLSKSRSANKLAKNIDFNDLKPPKTKQREPTPTK
jgi:hypothetical protein